MMTNRVVVLGGGTGGTLTANRLRRVSSTAETEITVIDQDDRHVYQPGLLFVPFGLDQLLMTSYGREVASSIAGSTT